MLSIMTIGLVAGTSYGQLRLFDPLPGYDRVWATHVSADGRMIAVEMFNFAQVGYDGYVWRDGQWDALPQLGRTNLNYGLSADGMVGLNYSIDVGGSVLSLTRGSERTQIPTSGNGLVRAGFSRNGERVYYNQLSAGVPGRTELWLWNSGASHSVALMPEAVWAVEGIHAAGRDGSAVVDAVLEPQAGAQSQSRTYLYEGGSFTELGPVIGLSEYQSWTTGVSADDRTIVGVQQGWDPSAWMGLTTSWMYRDGVLSEIAVDGLQNLGVLGMSDDGSVMFGAGFDAQGSARWLLWDMDGHTTDLSDLLLAAGYDPGSYAGYEFQTISGDGRTVVGSVLIETQFGFTSRVFALTVPGPGGIGLLVGTGLLAARRRR